jgi:hypothetical protein
VWHSRIDTDILDSALLWDPLGGPAPEGNAMAFSIEMSESKQRLRGAARLPLAHLRKWTASPPHIYRPSAHAVRAQDSATSPHEVTGLSVTTRPLNALPHAALRAQRAPALLAAVAGRGAGPLRVQAATDPRTHIEEGAES